MHVVFPWFASITLFLFFSWQVDAKLELEHEERGNPLRFREDFKIISGPGRVLLLSQWSCYLSKKRNRAHFLVSVFATSVGQKYLGPKEMLCKW